MQRLEVSGAVRPIYGSLGVKRLIIHPCCSDLGRMGHKSDSSLLCVTSGFRRDVEEIWVLLGYYAA